MSLATPCARQSVMFAVVFSAYRSGESAYIGYMIPILQLTAEPPDKARADMPVRAEGE